MGAEPEEEVAGPWVRVGERRFVVDADAVAALLIYMEIERDAGLLKRTGEHESIFDFDGFVLPCVPNETRGRGFLHLKFVGEKFDEFGIRGRAKKIVFGAAVGEFAHADDRVAEYAEIRPAAEAVDRIGGFGIPRIELCEEG